LFELKGGDEKFEKKKVRFINLKNNNVI